MGTLHFTKASPGQPLHLALCGLFIHSASTPLLNAGLYGSKPKPDECPTPEDCPALSILWLLSVNQRLPLKAFLPPKQHCDDGLIISNKGRGTGVRLPGLESWLCHSLHYITTGKFFPSRPHPPHLYKKDNNTYQLDLSE